MKNVIVVNGEVDWQGFLPGLNVRQRWLQSCAWIYQDGALWVADREGRCGSTACCGGWAPSGPSRRTGRRWS